MTEEWLNQMEADANASTPKVYCLQCVFYRHPTPKSDDGCGHRHAQVIKESYRGRFVSYARPSERNGNNDCLDYEPWTVEGGWREMPLVHKGVAFGILFIALWLLWLWLLG